MCRHNSRRAKSAAIAAGFFVSMSLVCPVSATTYQITGTAALAANGLGSWTIDFNDTTNDGLLTNLSEITSFSGFTSSPPTNGITNFDTVLLIPDITGIANGGNGEWVFTGQGNIFGSGFATSNWTYELAATSSSSTPLPGALPLFASTLTGLGLLGWRRKRKQVA
jgi:hypothetical protein